MIDTIKEKSPKRVILGLVYSIFIFLILFMLLFKYYDANLVTAKGNPRFVNIDYVQLQEEADMLGNSSELINKTAKNVFVLTYHAVTRNPPKDSYEIVYEDFKANMFALKSQGYQTVSLEDFYLFLEGEKQLPDKSFLITFDDGTKTSFYNVDPILKALNYTAVMFVITGHSFMQNKSSPYYLNELELINMSQTGRWEIESHTHKTHFRLPVTVDGDLAPALVNKLWILEENRLETDEEFLTRISLDLENSKSILESKLNKTVSSFSLPYGDFGERGSNYAPAPSIIYNLTYSKFKLVFYQFKYENRIFRGNYPELKQNSHLVVRISADDLRTPEELLQRIEASRALELPYSENYINYNIWPTISGQVSFENNSLVLMEKEGLKSEILFAYLDGSYLWEDYEFSVKLIDEKPLKISLISRVTTSMDYVSCAYNNTSIALIKSNKGIKKKILSVDMPKDVSLVNGTNLSMSVSGFNSKCLINGKEVLGAKVLDMNPNGGVGIKIEGFEHEDKTFAFGNIHIKEETK